MGTYFQKQAAADRLYKLACAARVIKRARAVQRLTKRAEGGAAAAQDNPNYDPLSGLILDPYEPIPGPSESQKRNAIDLNKRNTENATGKTAPSASSDSKSKGSLLAALKALATNPYTIGGTAGSLAGSGIGALLAPKDKRLLYALLGSGIGTGLGVGGAAGYRALKKVK